MTLFILSLLALADETSMTINFEEVIIEGTIQKPSFQRVDIPERPQMKSLSELCAPTSFEIIIDIE